jgi:hypothetical protein
MVIMSREFAFGELTSGYSNKIRTYGHIYKRDHNVKTSES